MRNDELNDSRIKVERERIQRITTINLDSNETFWSDSKYTQQPYKNGYLFDLLSEVYFRHRIVLEKNVKELHTGKKHYKVRERNVII